MKDEPSFSVREQAPKAWIEDDFPKSARIALLHLLYDLIDKSYVENWVCIDRKLRRIAREDPDDSYDRAEAKTSVKNILESLDWAKVFDFLETLYAKLSSEVWGYDDLGNSRDVVMSREDVQIYIAAELEGIFLEEHLGYSFVKGQVRRRGHKHTRRQIAKVHFVLGDPRLDEALKHYVKARDYFEDPKKLDYENVVKDAVCAVEAAARSLFPKIKANTLGEIVKHLAGNSDGRLPGALAQTITGIYAFRCSAQSVAHGGTKGGKVTKDNVEYVLAVCASQIIFLYELATPADDPDPPL